MISYICVESSTLLHLTMDILPGKIGINSSSTVKWTEVQWRRNNKRKERKRHYWHLVANPNVAAVIESKKMMYMTQAYNAYEEFNTSNLCLTDTFSEHPLQTQNLPSLGLED